MPCNNNCKQGRLCDCVYDTDVEDLYMINEWIEYSIVVLIIVSSTAALGFFVGYVT
jgi:hypothetical protein